MLLRTLGGLDFTDFSFSRPKPLLLLTYLALEGPQERRHLAELFWSEAADHLKSLSVALSQLRKGAPGAVETDRHRVRTRVTADAVLLIDALASGRPEEAIDLYRGPFLSGLSLPGLGLELEEWIYRTREVLAERIRREILKLADAEAAANDFPQAGRRAEQAFRIAGASLPEDEELLRLHLLLVAGESPLERDVRREIEELGLEDVTPDRDAARERLRRAAKADGSPPRHNLPARRTSFIGRGGQLDLVGAALRAPRRRLVTLRGPAGVGKTRLALESARREVEEREFPGGVYFVALAAVREPGAVASKIADSLGLLGRTTCTPRDELVAHLAQRSALLVLDNLEHLTDAAVLVADLLESCPRLKVLTTSRVPLRLQGEQEIPIGPLPVPAMDVEDDDEIRRSPATMLFLDRARSIDPDLPADTDTLRAIAEVCRRLDGLPLAIELAAARVRLFSPATLAQRIGRRLDLACDGARDLPERHQTLRQAITWGYELLPSAERRLFRWLGVFEGGFDLDTVAGLDRRLDGERADVLSSLGTLVENSLVQVESANRGASRFFLLETVREFALEALHGEGDVEAVRRAHAEEFRSLAEKEAPRATGPTQAHWLGRMRAERENLETALAWAESHGKTATALGIANAVWRSWLVLYPLQTGIDRMERILRMPRCEDDERERALALNAAGTLRHELGELTPARMSLEQSLGILRRRSEPGDLAAVLNNLSWTSLLQGRVVEARRHAGEAARIAGDMSDRRCLAVALNNLAWIAHLQGKFGLAASRHRRNLDLRIRAGDARGEAYARANLSWAEVSRGRLDDAQRLVGEALPVLTALEDEQLIAWGLYVRSLVHVARGATDEALGDLQRSIASWRRVGNRIGLAWALAAQGHALIAANRAEEAAAPLEEASRANLDVGSPWTLLDALPLRAAICAGGAGSAAGRELLAEAARMAHRLAARERLLAACARASVSVPVLPAAMLEGR